MKTLVIPLLAAALIVTACVESAPPPPPPVRFDSGQPGTLEIESKPPGATIEVNGRSVGRAPCTAQLPVILSKGKWILKEDVTVLALPEENGQTPQNKFYEVLTEPPHFLTFDMRSNLAPHPVPDDIDR